MMRGAGFDQVQLQHSVALVNLILSPSRSAPHLHTGGAPARGLWPQVVSGRQTTGFWRKRQFVAHLGCRQEHPTLHTRESPGSGEGTSMVTVPEEFACFGGWHC